MLQRCGAHPFLPRCAAACQDAAHLSLATDYCAGGTLGGLLRIHGAFDEKVSEFYVACAVCALEFLHERRIVSRGLSPDGILLGADGGPKLGDFGCAKQRGGALTFYELVQPSATDKPLSRRAVKERRGRDGRAVSAREQPETKQRQGWLVLRRLLKRLGALDGGRAAEPSAAQPLPFRDSKLTLLLRPCLCPTRSTSVAA